MRAIVLPQDLTMIGHVRFHSSPDPKYLRRYARNAVEFGYYIFKEHRRQGYATEAVKAIIDWAQAEFGVHRFVASVSPDNQPSLRMIARCGFVRVGTELDEVDDIEQVFLRNAT